MPRLKKQSSSESANMRPALTPEARENQLISLAVDCVEERMRSGKASAQEYIHFLKLATTKQQLEIEKIRRENALLEAKAAALESSKKSEEMYTKAIAAMRSYAGIDNGTDNTEEVVLGID